MSWKLLVIVEPKFFGVELMLTCSIEHLVTFIEHEDPDAVETQILVANQGVETTGSTDDDMRMGILVLKDLGIFLNGSATVEDAGLNVGHVLAEAVVLVADLESQLASVAHDQNGALASNRLDLLKRGQDEDSSLTETRLGLADDVTSQKSLRNTILLD